MSKTELIDQREQKIKVIEKSTDVIVSKANEISITSLEIYQEVSNGIMRDIKNILSIINETFDPDIKKAHELHKSMVANKKRHSEILEMAEKALRSKMSAFLIEEKRKEEEAQRKAEEEARKAEEKRKAELEAQAKKWEEKGDVEKAEERREQAQAVFVAPKTVIPKTVDVSESLRSIWKARIDDVNQIPRELLIATDAQKKALQSHLDSLAKSLKTTHKIAGVTFYEEKSISIRK